MTIVRETVLSINPVTIKETLSCRHGVKYLVCDSDQALHHLLKLDELGCEQARVSAFPGDGNMARLNCFFAPQIEKLCLERVFQHWLPSCFSESTTEK